MCENHAWTWRCDPNRTSSSSVDAASALALWLSRSMASRMRSAKASMSLALSMSAARSVNASSMLRPRDCWAASWRRRMPATPTSCARS